ncbi:hypothetical protein EJB05_33855, partial [Eragrostis curvula]
MLWKTEHGGAYLRVEATSCRATKRKGRGGKRQQWCHKNMKGWSSRWLAEFLGAWVAHAPSQLQSSITDWIQNGKHIRPLGDEGSHLATRPMQNRNMMLKAATRRVRRARSLFNHIDSDVGLHLACSPDFNTAFSVKMSQNCVLRRFNGLPKKTTQGILNSVYKSCAWRS